MACQDIENKSHRTGCHLRRIRRRGWTTRRNTADNWRSRAIWPETKSKRSAATCTAQKVGSINGKRATKLTIQDGQQGGAPSQGASRTKRLSCQFFAPRSGASIGAAIAVKRTPARRYTPW